MGYPEYDRLREKLKAVAKKYNDTNASSKKYRYYIDLSKEEYSLPNTKRHSQYYRDSVVKPMLEGYRKHRPLVSADFRAKASCLIAKRGNSDIARYLPTKRLSSEESTQTAIIYADNYILNLSPEDKKQWGLPEDRYQVLLRKSVEGIVMVNLLPAGTDADILDCGCVNYTGGKYYVAIIKPQTKGYRLKILMSMTNGDKPEVMKENDPDAQSHLTGSLSLTWKS